MQWRNGDAQAFTIARYDILLAAQRQSRDRDKVRLPNGAGGGPHSFEQLHDVAFVSVRSHRAEHDRAEQTDTRGETHRRWTSSCWTAIFSMAYLRNPRSCAPCSRLGRHAKGAAPFYEGMERLGSRTPDLALIALRLVLAGRPADDATVVALRDVAARARAGDAAARAQYRTLARRD